MCYLLTVAFSNPIEAPLQNGDLRLEPFKLGGGGHHYETNLFPYSLTANSCSCDLISSDKLSPVAEHELRSLRSSLKKAGLSKSKIRKKVRERQNSFAKLKILRDDVKDLINKVSQSQSVIELILHWHSGDFSQERFSVTNNPAEDWNGRNTINQIVEDVRYRYLIPNPHTSMSGIQ